MSLHDIRRAGQDNVEYTRRISRELIEKAMEMRCKSYLSHVKAELLTETIFEVDKSRKYIRKANEELERRVEKRTLDLRQSNTTLQREIKKHMRTEDQLRKLSEAVEHAGEGIFITDDSGNIEYVNRAFCTMMGYAVDEVIGKSSDILKSDEQDESFYRDLWAMITAGKVWNSAIVNRRKDGGLIPVMMTIAPIRDRKGNVSHFVATMLDMTKQKELEAQFQQAQKMEAIGTLVGGIAHDFNNMLAAMIANIYLLKMGAMSASKETREHLDSIEALSFRASDMIKQLLAFARKARIAKADISLTSLMKEALKLQAVNVPENIGLEHHFCRNALNIHADATQLQQVFINLVNNARDALAGVKSPLITIQLAPFAANDAFAEKHGVARGLEFARLSVSDNGCGMSGEQIDKIFDPFFTTKEVGKGTGLGLSMVFGAIESHQGLIEVESSPGKGSAFHIHLPLLPTEDAGFSGKIMSEVKPGQGETILLVDDNTEVLASSKKVLEQIGYAVLTAIDGLEATELYTERHKDISLIILDLIMPRMDGTDAAKAILGKFPDAKIMFATAYDSSGKLAKEMADDHLLLSKPFAIQLLSQSIRDQLDD